MMRKWTHLVLHATQADRSAVVVPAAASASAGAAADAGWTLTFAPGWQLQPDERLGDLPPACDRAGARAPPTSACPIAAP